MVQARRKPTGKARDLFSDRYERRRDRLSPAFQRVAGYIDANRLAVLTSSAIEIARAVGTSDATVIRTVQALGFAGLQELRRELAAGLGQRTTPADNLKRTLDDAEEQIDAAVEDLLDVYAAGLEVLRSPEFRENLMKALSVLHDARRIFVFGIGPTAHIAAYFAARLRRKGRQQRLINRTGPGLADQLLELESGDAVVMLAYGSLYKEANMTLAEARRLRLPVVLISDSAQSELSSRARCPCRSEGQEREGCPARCDCLLSRNASARTRLRRLGESPCSAGGSGAAETDAEVGPPGYVHR